ncbi:MAG: hypothetical protein ACRYFX_03660 [Janthinobacterium lividum]
MGELSQLYQQHAAGLPAAEQQQVAAFLAKLESFVHAPDSLAAARRTEVFARQPALVALVAQVLPQYRPWTLPWYDIIGYWYSVALLSVAHAAEARQALASCTTEALAVGWRDLNIWQRNYTFFAAAPELATLRAAVEDYFQQLLPQLEALEWARQLGLQVPATPTWNLGFELTTDGENKFSFQLTEAEKQPRLILAVRVFAAAYGNGQCWEMRVYNDENSTGGTFGGPADRYLRVRYHLHTLPVAPSLLQLGKFLAAVEAATGAQFVRQVTFSYFSKGIKNKKAVPEWVAKLELGA